LTIQDRVTFQYWDSCDVQPPLLNPELAFCFVPQSLFGTPRTNHCILLLAWLMAAGRMTYYRDLPPTNYFGV